MPSLRAVQEEMRRLIFFRDPEQTESRLWGNGIPDRLKVYRNNTRTNWSETLDCDFRLTKAQFDPDGWQALRRNYFVKHPAGHWELNTSMSSFVKFLGSQAVKPYVKELADFEWHDLRIFIDRAEVKSG